MAVGGYEVSKADGALITGPPAGGMQATSGAPIGAVVGIVGRNRLARRALSDALRAVGFRTCDLDGPRPASGETPGLLVADIETHSDLPLLRASMSPGGSITKTVAVLETLRSDLVLDVLRSGAMSVVEASASSATLVAAVRAAVHGDSLLPASVLRALVREDARLVRPEGITDLEVDLLRGLLDGSTARELGAALGYSVRRIYDLLERLYDKIGARNRAGAIALAARWEIDLDTRRVGTDGRRG